MMMKKLLRKNLLMPGLDLDSSSFMCFSLLLLIDLTDKGSKARSHFETFTLCLVFLLSENADQDEQSRTCAEEKDVRSSPYDDARRRDHLKYVGDLYFMCIISCIGCCSNGCEIGIVFFFAICNKTGTGATSASRYDSTSNMGYTPSTSSKSSRSLAAFSSPTRSSNSTLLISTSTLSVTRCLSGVKMLFVNFYKN